jgi:hypothetical protein
MYRVVLPAGCVEDLSGNRLPAAYSFSFCTRGVDREPPVVLWADPPDGAADVPRDAEIRIAFSEPLMSSDVQLLDADERPVSGERFYETVGGREIVTFLPERWLAPNSGYKARILSGSVKDEAGNPLMENFTAVFRTGEKALGRGPTGRGSWCQEWRQVQADWDSSVYEVSLPGDKLSGVQFVLLGTTRSAGQARTDCVEVPRVPNNQPLPE